jgi:sulfite exporter TauE/SafE
MRDLQYFPTMLGVGFLLGMRHALDADHVVAVSALLARSPELRRSWFVGLCWGCGHTATLLLIGLVVLVFRVTIPGTVARACEAVVGLMLVVLGLALARSLYHEQWHLHTHDHDGTRHIHLHSHRRGEDHAHRHGWWESLSPVAVGMVHGLAGSAALMLLVLSTAQTLGEGVAYILLFGLGSVLGMLAVGTLISLPLLLSAAWGWYGRLTVQGLASLGSVGFGLAILFR